MSNSRLRLIAAIGLVIGAVLGMAGTLPPSAPLRGLAWGIEATALIIASALLAIHHFRRGNDVAAAGFLFAYRFFAATLFGRAWVHYRHAA